MMRVHMHFFSHLTAPAARGTIKTYYNPCVDYSSLQNTNSQFTQFALFEILRGSAHSINTSQARLSQYYV